MYYLLKKYIWKENSSRRAGKEWTGAVDEAGGKPGECEVSKARSREWTGVTAATERSGIKRAGLKTVQYAQQQEVTCDPSKDYSGGGRSWAEGLGVVAAKLYVHSWTCKLRAGIDNNLKKPALLENRNRVILGWDKWFKEGLWLKVVCLGCNKLEMWSFREELQLQ